MFAFASERRELLFGDVGLLGGLQRADQAFLLHRWLLSLDFGPRCTSCCFALGPKATVLLRCSAEDGKRIRTAAERRG